MGGGEPARWVLVWGGQRWRWHRRRRRRCRRRRGAWAAAWDRLWATVARVAAVPNQGRRRYVGQVWQRQKGGGGELGGGVGNATARSNGEGGCKG